MTLQERLNEFRFNLETMELLQSLGRTRAQVVTEMAQLNFNESLVNFYNDSRTLFNSVMLRLNLYSEQNQNESSVRKSLSILNNNMVNSLVDYLYSATSLNETSQQVEKVVKQDVSQEHVVTREPVEQEHVTQNQEENNVSEDEMSENDSDDQNDDPFDSFFSSCVKQTDEPTDIVKSSDFYQAFSEWYESNYDEEVPDKKELKGFLNERLGKSKKNTWTNVVLNC
jgi:hypothetical protein